MKDKFREKAKVWGPRIAFFAVAGFTGIAVIVAYKGYRAMRGIEKFNLDFTIPEIPFKK